MDLALDVSIWVGPNLNLHVPTKKQKEECGFVGAELMNETLEPQWNFG